MRQLSGPRAFFTITLGQLVSTVGSGMTRFGLGIWVLEETGDAAAYTTLLFAAVLPLGLASLVVGPLVDRWNRRWTMLLANSAASASTLVIALLYFSDALELWHLYVALTLNGIANAFILPSLESSVPLMVPREQLGRAQGLMQMVQSFEIILAPVLAVAVLVPLGLGAIFVVDFVTFGISIAALTLSAVPQPRRLAGDAAESLWAGFRFGVDYMRARPALLTLLFYVTATMFLMPGIGYALATPLALSFSDEAGAGVVLTSFGVGSLVSGVLLAAWGGPQRRMDGILAACAAAGAAAIVTGLRPSLALTSVGVFFIGMSFVSAIGLNRVIWQVKASPAVQGRLFSLRVAIGVAAQSLGILAAGPLAESVFEPLMEPGGGLAGSIGSVLGVGDGRGMGLMYVLAGALLLLIALVSALVRRIRLLEDQLPDFDPEEAQAVEAESAPALAEEPAAAAQSGAPPR